MKALVTGGTGTLGRLVVPRLRDAGGEIRVLSRHRPEVTEGIEYVTGDLATGEGSDAAVAGTEIIVHCAGSAKGDEDKASVVEPKFLCGWRRSGACIARPTREGYRVVCRPRRTPRGACLGGANRKET